MSSQKEKDILMNILELYKDMPNLWNKNHVDYKNKSRRYDGFRVLLEMYKHFDKDATIQIIKKKIENMRTAYLKEAKKVNASKHTGAGSEDVYVPSLWYFDALAFLGSTTEPCRPITDSLENVEGNENSSSSEDEKCQAGPSSVVSAKKKKGSFLQKQDQLLQSAEKLMSMKEEEWEVLGKSIGLQLRDLKSRELTIAQKLIGDVIFYAKMGRLNEDTHIALGSTSLTSPSLSNTSDPSSSSSSYFKINNIKLSHPYRVHSPRPSPPQNQSLQNRVESPHPSPQYYAPSPQYHVESPHPSPQYHAPSPQYHVQSPIPSPQYHNPSSQYHVQSPHPSPQYHIQTSQPPRQHVQILQPSSEFNIQEFEPPQIHIPDQLQYKIHIPTQTDSTLQGQSNTTAHIEFQSSSPSHSSIASQNDATSNRETTSKKINIQEYLIIHPKK